MTATCGACAILADGPVIARMLRLADIDSAICLCGFPPHPTSMANNFARVEAAVPRIPGRRNAIKKVHSGCGNINQVLRRESNAHGVARSVGRQQVLNPGEDFQGALHIKSDRLAPNGHALQLLAYHEFSRFHAQIAECAALHYAEQRLAEAIRRKWFLEILRLGT